VVPRSVAALCCSCGPQSREQGLGAACDGGGKQAGWRRRSCVPTSSARERAEKGDGEAWKLTVGQVFRVGGRG